MEDCDQKSLSGELSQAKILPPPLPKQAGTDESVWPAIREIRLPQAAEPAQLYEVVGRTVYSEDPQKPISGTPARGYASAQVDPLIDQWLSGRSQLQPVLATGQIARPSPAVVASSPHRSASYLP